MTPSGDDAVYSLVAPEPLTPSEKVQEYEVHYELSDEPRRTAYVAPKPPKGLNNSKVFQRKLEQQSAITSKR